MRQIRALALAGMALFQSAFGFIDPPRNLSPSGPVATLTPTLSWSSVTGATGGYKIELAKGRTVDIGNAIITFYTNSTSWAIPANQALEPYKDYTFRVIAYERPNGGGPAYSFPTTFTTNDLPPPVPTGLEPANGQTNYPTSKALLFWMPHADSYNYFLRWGKSTTQFTGGFQRNNYTLLDLEPATTYFWQVQSLGITGRASAFTAWRSFTTIQDITPGTPNLTSPANNAFLSGTTVTLAYNATNALEYQVQVSSAADFSADIILDQTNVKTATTQVTIPTAKYGVKFYWRVQAKAHRLSAWSATRYFTCNAPSGTMQWPRGSAAAVLEPFGPRSTSDPAGWFHSGINIGPAGGGFKAPYSMVCVLTKQVNPDLFRATFKTIDAAKEPKHLLFSDLNMADKAKVNPGNSWNQGVDLGVRGGVQNDAYLHMEAYRGTDMTIVNGEDDDYSNNSDEATYEANRRRARNPMEWLPNISPGAAVTLDISPNYSPFPTENGVSYFEIHVKSPSPQFGLDKLNLSMTNLAGTKSNDLLMIPIVGRISFNDGFGVDRGDGSGIYPTPTLETHPLLGTSGYAVGNEGVKVFTKPYAGGNKELVFRYYLSSTDVQEIRAEAIGASGLTLASAIRTLAPGCINCAGLGPVPPNVLTATPVTNGIRLRWGPSPDASKTTYEYAIYRRPNGSTELPKVIAMVPYTSLAYLDVFDKSPNQIYPGKSYRYSIAAVGSSAEGCNGPKKPGCNGSFCPLSCVNEAVATAPTTVYNLLFQGEVVRTTLGTLSALHSVTLGQDSFRKPGSVTFTAGRTMNIQDKVTIEDGSIVTLNVTN